MSRANVLVTADWAEENLDAPGVVFVEVDEDTTAYDGGHIPGAVRIDWRTELQDQVRRDFVDKAGFEKLLSAKGISNDDTVVLYGGNNNWFAAYAYWYFTLYGHTDVKLIDGGRKKWELDGRKLVTDVPRAPADRVHREGAGSSIRAFRDEVVDAIGNTHADRHPLARGVRRPDARPRPPPAGAGAARRGHIPGAANIPWSRATNEDGTFRSDDELRALYGGEGVHPDAPAITYCRIGERSSPHVVRAARAARLPRRQETTTAPGPSTARSSASRCSSATSGGPPHEDAGPGRRRHRRVPRRRPAGRRPGRHLPGAPPDRGPPPPGGTAHPRRRRDPPGPRGHRRHRRRAARTSTTSSSWRCAAAALVRRSPTCARRWAPEPGWCRCSTGWPTSTPWSGPSAPTRCWAPPSGSAPRCCPTAPSTRSLPGAALELGRLDGPADDEALGAVRDELVGRRGDRHPGRRRPARDVGEVGVHRGVDGADRPRGRGRRRGRRHPGRAGARRGGRRRDPRDRRGGGPAPARRPRHPRGTP